MPPDAAKVRVSTLRQMKADGRRIVAATAYDTLTGRWADRAGMDLILVGDSLGNTALGLENTIAVRLDAMIHHAAAVVRGVRRALVVGDLPFMTYKISPEQALASAARFLQESSIEAVKLEGGAEMAPMVARIVACGIPVLGHIGLLPQSIHAQGGYRVQGRERDEAQRLIADARALEAAGAFAVVLEGMPAPLAGEISRAVAIPTIGIGAGAECDGQVLVLSDLLGMTEGPAPKFAKAYARLGDIATEGLRRYADDVRDGTFPDDAHSYHAD